VAARQPDELARREWQGKFYHRPAGGESWADVASRLRGWLSDADRRWAGRRVFVVCHDVVVLLLRYVCEELDEQQVAAVAQGTPLRNAALSRFARKTDGGWEVVVYDDVQHLHEAGLPVTEHRGERRDVT
jgi:broad specificity phosphatase PhoE